MRKANLITHCGANVVRVADVHNAKTPRPTSSYTPIPHGTFLDLILKKLPSDMRIVSEAHALSHGGARYFGILQFEDPSDIFAPVIGIRNSHDKSFPAGGCAGENVFVCDNLAFHGEAVFRRKHTTYMMRDLPGLIEDMLTNLVGMRKTIYGRLVALQTQILPERDRNHLLVRAVENGVIPSSKLGQVLAEIKEPRHPEHLQFGAESAWVVYQAFTEIMKPRGDSENDLFNLPKKTIALHNLLREIARTKT